MKTVMRLSFSGITSIPARREAEQATRLRQGYGGQGHLFNSAT
jgi:hypothetical protein